MSVSSSNGSEKSPPDEVALAPLASAITAAGGPPPSTSTRSDTNAASSISWVTNSAALPVSRTTRRNSANTSRGNHRSRSAAPLPPSPSVRSMKRLNFRKSSKLALPRAQGFTHDGQRGIAQGHLLLATHQPQIEQHQQRQGQQQPEKLGPEEVHVGVPSFRRPASDARAGRLRRPAWRDACACR